MPEPTQPALTADESVDTRALSEQLGSAEELTTLSPVAWSNQLTKIHSLPALREFLLDYTQRVLGPAELTVICRAWDATCQSRYRDLLELDTQLASDQVLKEFEVASRHAGKRQLNRMRPLRDLRALQRYRTEVNEGRAYGWHTVVYGMVLATYSIPLRPGLIHYSRQTLTGFVEAARRTLEFSESSALELHLELTQAARPLVEKAVLKAAGPIKLIS